MVPFLWWQCGKGNQSISAGAIRYQHASPHVPLQSHGISYHPPCSPMTQSPCWWACSAPCGGLVIAVSRPRRRAIGSLECLSALANADGEIPCAQSRREYSEGTAPRSEHHTRSLRGVQRRNFPQRGRRYTIRYEGMAAASAYSTFSSWLRAPPSAAVSPTIESKAPP